MSEANSPEAYARESAEELLWLDEDLADLNHNVIQYTLWKDTVLADHYKTYYDNKITQIIVNHPEREIEVTAKKEVLELEIAK